MVKNRSNTLGGKPWAHPIFPPFQKGWKRAKPVGGYVDANAGGFEADESDQTALALRWGKSLQLVDSLLGSFGEMKHTSVVFFLFYFW